MSDGTVAHELKDGETYQIDSDEYDSDDNAGDQLGDAEYDELVAEGELLKSSQVIRELCALTLQPRMDSQMKRLLA